MEVQVGQYQLATEVLRLDEPFSDDDVQRAADAYESTYHVPLVRPGEYDPETLVPNKKFLARLKNFADPADAGVTGDPAVARRELRKLLVIAKKKGLANLTDREKAGIHENQKALGLPLMDFKAKQRSAKQIVDQAQERYADIQTNAITFQERLDAIKAIADVTTLQLFAEHDKSEEVRDAAFERIKELELAGVTGG